MENPIDRQLQEMRDLREEWMAQKAEETGAAARHLAICITELEKLIAYAETWVRER